MTGALVKLSPRSGEVACDESLDRLTNLRIEITEDIGRPIARVFYAKVTGGRRSDRGFSFHMTSTPPDLADWLELRRTAHGRENPSATST